MKLTGPETSLDAPLGAPLDSDAPPLAAEDGLSETDRVWLIPEGVTAAPVADPMVGGKTEEAPEVI